MRSAVFALAVAAAFVGLALLTAPAYCQDAAKTASFTDDMEKLTTAVKLTDEQKKKIDQIKAARDTAVEKWNAANQKKIEAAEKRVADAKDDKARAPAERSLKLLLAGRDKIYADAEKPMFAVLTKEQKGTWNGGILTEAATGDLAGIELTEAQTKKLADICKAKGEAMAVPVDSASLAAGLATFMGPIVRQVLTPAQQKEYVKSHKPEPKPKAGAGG
jgi:Spy/CpxP family protein refolding chaperone